MLQAQEAYMQAALKEAERAFELDEVPVGAVVVYQGNIIARAHNMREALRDPTAHAEMLALRRAAEALGGWRLHGCSLYVTLEPCPMCAGGILQARMDAVYFGVNDYKAGCCGTIYDIVQDKRFNHTTKVYGGILEQECYSILRAYFNKKRCKNV
ncbi:MAG: nucleoside deaminase [Christensenellales bacterium]